MNKAAHFQSLVITTLFLVTSHASGSGRCTGILDGLTPKPSFRKGTEELQRFVRITRTTPESLAKAQEHLDGLTEEKTSKMLNLAQAKLRGDVARPAVQANLEHVENQHLKPLSEDAQELAKAFDIDPRKLELLMATHDLGKVEIPKDMMAVLKQVFPTNFVAREILTHEYASMYWIDKLGKEAGLSPQEIYALQTLIANHNFGPSLARPGNEEFASHWWPSNFRNQLLPELKRLGVNIENVFEKSADGSLQYRNAEGNTYSALLSAYDRAIANEHNSNGLATWQKFAQQDYDAFQNNPKGNSPFNGPGLVARMETSARWAKEETQNLWKTLMAQPGTKIDSLESFAPYQRQMAGMDRLTQVIQKVKQDNPVAVAGSVNYRDSKGTLYRVDEKKAADGKAQLLRWNGTSFDVIKEDASPVRILFELIKSDS